MKKDITALYCFVDDFCQISESFIKSKLLGKESKKPTRVTSLNHSEIMTIVLLYHQSPCKNFKYFYLSYLQLYKNDFKLPSYERFVLLKKRILIYLVLLLQWYSCQAKASGISYIDSTPLAACSNKRVSRNKVFAGIATLGKTSMGWFYGLKLHLLINEQGQIQGVRLTTANTDDRAVVASMTKKITGLLFGDKGYISSELFDTLYTRGLKLVTGIKKNMKNKLMPIFEKILLRKRSIIETVFSVLKGSYEIEHTRHRSVWNALVHILSALITYCMKPSKPSISNIF